MKLFSERASLVSYNIRNISLEVHHKFYYDNKLPWEYLLDDLITVCEKCHREIHNNETIYVYFDESKET